MRKRLMNRILGTLMAGVLVIGMTACGNQQLPGKSSEENSEKGCTQCHLSFSKVI